MENTKRGLLLAKIETTYGVDAVPVASANIIAAVRNEVNLSIKGELITRDILDGGFHRMYGPNVLPEMEIRFRTELRGNRTNGVAADISVGTSGNAVSADPLLRACNLSPTYTAESGGGVHDGAVIYKPVVPSGVGDSITIYFYSELKLYVLTGCKGDFTINLNAGKIGYIEWTFRGMFNPPIDSSIPGSQVWVATVPPLWERQFTHYQNQTVTLDHTQELWTKASHAMLNYDQVRARGTMPSGNELVAETWYWIRDRATNTWKVSTTRGGSVLPFSGSNGTVTFDGQPALIWDNWAPDGLAQTGPVANALTLRLGNNIASRPDSNMNYGIRGMVITDRNSGGSLNPESVGESTHAIWSDWRSGRIKKLYAALGHLSGNAIRIGAKTVIQNVNYGDDSGKRIQSCDLAISLEALGDAYGEDFYIEFK